MEIVPHLAKPMTTATDWYIYNSAARNVILEPNPFNGAFTLPAKISAAAQRVSDAIAAAVTSFPNNNGNYIGKRMAIVAAPPMEPRERFTRLAAHYLSHRQTYRNGPFADPNWQKNYFAEQNAQ
jgi:hypothetical protein